MNKYVHLSDRALETYFFACILVEGCYYVSVVITAEVYSLIHSKASFKVLPHQ